MLPSLVGVFAGKLKAFIVMGVVIAVIAGLGFASLQIYQYGKSSCQRQAMEAIENERVRQSKTIAEMEARLQRERHVARLRLREVDRASDPTECLDRTDVFPDGVLDHLRRPD